MKKTILEIYALAVCFFTVACFVIIVGSMAWNIVELVSPGFTISNHQYGCHVTNNSYRDCYSEKSEYKREENPKIFPEGEELTKTREKSYAKIIKLEKRNALQGIVKNLIIIFIDLIVFLAHWIIAKRARETV